MTREQVDWAMSLLGRNLRIYRSDIRGPVMGWGPGRRGNGVRLFIYHNGEVVVGYRQFPRALRPDGNKELIKLKEAM